MHTTAARTSRVFRFTFYLSVALVALALLATGFLRRKADAIARQRILGSVREQFGTPATLDDVHVTLHPGLQITGRGLRVPGTGTQPSMEVGAFQFATDFSSLFNTRTTLVTATVEGLILTIPPGPDHAPFTPPPTTHTHGAHGDFSIAQVTVHNAQLIIQNADPAKFPLLFHISHLVFNVQGDGKPIHFDAILTNPRPIGDVHAHGLIGPRDLQHPRETPVSARFDFAQADLSSINGLEGHLQGRGTLGGSIGQLVAEGDAAMPDFSMAPGLVHTALTTHFSVILDALTGQVTFNRLTAHLLHTDVTAQGSITRIPAGHEIALNTELHGRAEDLLDLVSPTHTRPLFTAALAARANFHIPPGRERMLLKVSSIGNGTLTNLHWVDPNVQQKVDSLSVRALGNPQAAKDTSRLPNPPSTLTNHFLLNKGRLELQHITYRLPGATVLMEATYGLQAETLDSHGVVRTAAEASHMTTGIKSLLLKPLDPLLRKPGAGMQLPISLTGPKDSLKLMLDLGHRKADDRLAPTAHK